MEAIMEEYSQMPSDLLLPTELDGSALVLLDQGLLGSTPSEPTSYTPHSRTNRVKRPHTKSRRGCYNCKRRRIKCPETKPSCANCIHKDLGCVYPAERDQATFEKSAQSSESSRDISPLPGQISTSPFTGDDLRFWHHSLINARPHLPFGNEATWLSTVPALAHDCPHLLHAMLSLGASHCSHISQIGTQYTPVAISHRGKALKALSATLSKDDCTVLEMDTALATCYTLTFQAHHMADGIVDFVVMVRGCGLVTDWYFQKRRTSQIFTIQSRDEMSAMITSWLPADKPPINDTETITACIASLDKLHPLLQTPAQQYFHHALRQNYISLLTSHRDAFISLANIYTVWTQLTNAEFLSFIDPENHISRALFLHYVVIDAFMRPVYAELERERNVAFGGGQFLIYRWAEALYRGLPGELRECVRGVMRLLAINMMPLVQVHRECYPAWEYELGGFVEWLGRWVPQDILGSI